MKRRFPVPPLSQSSYVKPDEERSFAVEFLSAKSLTPITLEVEPGIAEFFKLVEVKVGDRIALRSHSGASMKLWARGFYGPAFCALVWRSGEPVTVVVRCSELAINAKFFRASLVCEELP